MNNTKNLKNNNEENNKYKKPEVVKYADLVDITGLYQRQPCKTSSC